MTAHEQGNTAPLPASTIVSNTADEIIHAVTREYIRRAGGDPDRFDFTDRRQWAMYKGWVMLATENQCSYMSGMTGRQLQLSHPGLFSEIVMVQSHKTEDSERGRREAKRWVFDTWLVVRTNEGENSKYLTLSPAVHTTPAGRKLTPVYECNTLEEVIEIIKAQRPGWEWPTAEEIMQHDRNPDAFFAQATDSRYGFARVDVTNAAARTVSYEPEMYDDLDLFRNTF